MISIKFHFEVEVEGDKFEHIGPSNTTYQKAYQAADMVRSYYFGKIKEAEEQQKAVQEPQETPKEE
jgi:hypothetical protein